MLKEFITEVVFLFILAGLVCSFVMIQKSAERQKLVVEKIIEKQNENY